MVEDTQASFFYTFAFDALHNILPLISFINIQQLDDRAQY